MATPLLVLCRLAAVPWYLGGSFTEETVHVLGYTSWQMALLTYHTLTFLREPMMWVQIFGVAWWMVDHYGFPSIPVPFQPEATLATSYSPPRLGVCGQYFEFHFLSSGTTLLHCPEPLRTALVNVGCAPPSLVVVDGLKFLPVSPPPPVPTGLLVGRFPSASLLEISISFDFHFSLAPLRWWRLSDLEVATAGHETVATQLPEYLERWRQFHAMSTFFRDMFVGGSMPMG